MISYFYLVNVRKIFVWLGPIESFQCYYVDFVLFWFLALLPEIYISWHITIYFSFLPTLLIVVNSLKQVEKKEFSNHTIEIFWLNPQYQKKEKSKFEIKWTVISLLLLLQLNEASVYVGSLKGHIFFEQ
jgi:hypothetical protein